MSIVYIGATNTTYGNPRRGWIIGYGDADAYFVDEGYLGRGALREAGIENAPDVPLLRVTPLEYRTWKRRTKLEAGQ